MTTPMLDQRKPCDNGPDCEHKICHVCSRPIRSDNHRVADHPGAYSGHIRNRLCGRCMIEGHKPYRKPKPEPTPAPDPYALVDERHILLSNKEMTRIHRDHPVQFAWHVERRKRIKARLPELNTNLCTVGDCTGQIRSYDLCNKHYMRFLRHGDPTFSKYETTP